jgi:hypothetical protein
MTSQILSDTVNKKRERRREQEEILSLNTDQATGRKKRERQLIFHTCMGKIFQLNKKIILPG